MKKINMVDLYGQYEKIKFEVDHAIQEVIVSSAFIKGKEIKELENELAEYHQSKYAIACANGTDALQIALMALGLKTGDEVISPDFTFISTVEVSAVLKLKPVLADVNHETFTISPESIEKNINRKTRAIVPVHLYGQCADMNAVMDLAHQYNLYVIEDNAQAIGARYSLNDGTVKMSGTIGDIGCTSFFPSKNLGCFGDGGALFTDNDELAERIKAIANHGMKVKYYNDFIGINSRLDTIQAAILRIKLRNLNQYIKARQELATSYDNAFNNIEQLGIPVRDKNSTHVFHQYTLLLNEEVDRDDFKAFLQNKEIPTMIYYPVPMHRQTAYKYLKQAHCNFPVTNDITKRVISLPMHTEMDNEQMSYIIENVKQYFN